MAEFDLWGSKLSPFSNKAEACLAYAGKSYRRLPAEGGKVRNMLVIRKIERAKKKQTIYRYPRMTSLDEYPLVPLLLESGGGIQYDTSGIARWLDERRDTGLPLWPEDPLLSFIAQLIDEAFDEFVLYILHYQRWVVSVKSTWATKELYKEFKNVPFLPKPDEFMLGFAKRQIKRLPYTMSVAPFDGETSVPSDFRPPEMEGWPETYTMLSCAWERYLHGLETVLAQQPWLLGERFTIADASAFGGLAALQFEPDTLVDIEQRAPATLHWVNRIRVGEHVASAGELAWNERLIPLLNIIMETFVPLMQQNETAYKAWLDKGEVLFNEAAHDEGKALYEGELLGYPFRMVVKTFQVQVWQDIIRKLSTFTKEQRAKLERKVPRLSLIGQPPETQIKLIQNHDAMT